MLDRLERLWVTADRDRKGRKGFVYEPNRPPGLLTVARAGDIVSTSSAPPWIVVDHCKDSIVFTNWPGKLWFVEVIEAAPPSEQITETYTRASAVRLIETSSAHELFGTHGTSIENLLTQVSQLTLSAIDSLNSPEPAAYRKYSEAWSKWLKQEPDDTSDRCDHSFTLGAGPRGNDSPIGKGFVLLFNVIHKRANELEGDSAFTIDSEGEIEFVRKWQIAFDAARLAAMAYGAPELLSESACQLLAAPWERRLKR